MSRFETYEVAAFEPVPQGFSSPRLPYHVEPAHEEALISWLARLATRFGVSVQILLRSLGIKAELDRGSLGWFRPAPTILDAIAARTGVDTPRLRKMTLCEWAPMIQKDEGMEGFGPSRPLSVAALCTTKQPMFLCAQCLRGGTEPYLRLSWMLGWTALCPQHRTVLTSRCPHCRSPLKLPVLSAAEPHAVHRCGDCHVDLFSAEAPAAHEHAIRLQRTLLTGKQQGVTELVGIGPLPWPVVSAFVDALLDRVCLASPARRRARLYARVRHDFDLGNELTLGEWDSRYGHLLLMAWLLDRWPRNLRSGLSILRASPIDTQIAWRHELSPMIRRQLQEIWQCVGQKRSAGRKSWRSWLEQLPQTSEELRARAHRERLEHRRVRLIALAGLRDGRSIKEVAAAIRYQPETVSRWLHQGAQNGLEVMLERSRGRQMLSSAQVAELALWIADYPLPGAPEFRLLQAADVIAESMTRFAVDITHQVASRLLRMHANSRRWRRTRLYPIRAMDSRMKGPIHK